MHSFTIVIPTYKRPKELRACLASIFQQTIFPTAILVVDDDQTQNDLLAWASSQCHKRGIHWMYQTKQGTGRERGTSQSRNLALSLVQTPFLLILDDDIVLDEYFLAPLLDTCKQKMDSMMFGVGGVIQNNRRIGLFENVYRWIFGLGSELSWDVNDRAYQVWDDGVISTTKGFYAHGGLFLYQVDALRKLGGFMERSLGRNALEDVDAFMNAKKAGYHVWIEPRAHAIHNHTPTARESSVETGKKEMQNRRYIYNTYAPKGYVRAMRFGWAHVGWILKTLLSGKWKKAYGMIIGLFV